MIFHPSDICTCGHSQMVHIGRCCGKKEGKGCNCKKFELRPDPEKGPIEPMTYDFMYEKVINKEYDTIPSPSQQFRSDLRSMLEHESRHLLTDEQFSVIFENVFENVWPLGHSSGFSEVLNYAVDFIELIKVFKD